ncbi:MFS transporter [Lactobacillus gasseri]|uniref:Transport protein HsrA n=1 Tax=Lactobacillus gasseri TaxID=1596 RepID=A0ABY3BFX6_LACGS|nr:MFS transporter [Lactobacillus gasseri]MCZ3934057.1 MFS transporter [Lactobacillus gasseri]MCZ3935858.1 MFS transporter [Lactobacillus gasseri]MCZ3937668.1 MFS transporter [Lactobacillus gasseri]MCZ3944991.1 MFS transporter [Lactobacillus gasseri]MCZ3950482.1 MFS transporter [Lactobacillus gasseri]
MTKEKIPKHVLAAIFATGILSFSGVIIETSMNIAFPTLMKEFNLATNTVQWLTSIYLLTISIIVSLSANLKAHFKTKKLFITANLLYLSGLIIGACAPNFEFLLLGRIVEGLGTGIALPLMFNIIMEQVPKSRVGVMMGIGNMITGIAPALGPTFGGLVVTHLGWRWIFYIMIPFILISLVLGIGGIRQKSQLREVKFDLLSMLLIAIFFIGMILGFSNLSTGNYFAFNCLGAILIALVSLGLLVYRSNRINDPVLDLNLFKNKFFAAHAIGFFLIQIISLGNAFLLPNYIQLVNGDSALIAGLVVLPAGFAGAFLAPFGGSLLDRYGARKPILIGSSFMLLELLIFTIFTSNLSNLLILFIYIFYMGGMGMMMGCVMTDALDHLEKSEVTQGNAILNTLQEFAGAVGTSTTAAFVAFAQRKAGSKGAIPTAHGTHLAYIFLLVLVLIIIAIFMKYTQVRNKND